MNMPNQPIRKAQGMTLIGFIIVLALIVFVAYLGMRIVPIYIEYYNVVSAMKGVQATPGVSQMSPRQIKGRLYNRLNVNYVDSIGEDNIKVTRRGGLQLSVEYEVRKPVIGNLDVVAHFNKSVPLSG